MRKSIILLLVAMGFLVTISSASAQAPTLINFQGKLTDSFQAPVTGIVDVLCSIYDNDVAGRLVWEEEHIGVQVNNGIFNLMLGNGAPLTANELTSVFEYGEDRWLEIQIGTDTPMFPRQQIASVAYSFHSDSASIATSAEDVPNMDITPKSVSINGYGLVVNSMGEWTGEAISDIIEDDPQVEVTTINNVPKWDSEKLIDSSIFENSENVGIGTAAPQEKLSVVGMVQSTSGGFKFPDGTIQEKAVVVTEDSILDGVSWDEVKNKPSDFDDGMISWDEVNNIPPDLSDGEIAWTELKNIPAEFMDGKDNGITEESDPQVGENTTNRIPKWDGSALSSSQSINENSSGNVGIGTATPQEKLSVVGMVQSTSGGFKFPDGTIQEKAVVVTEDNILDGVSWGEVKNVPPDLSDGEIAWAELKNIPAEFMDGKDNGITEEIDPKVGNNTTNRIPKWNGSALSESQSINENSSGNVGIGTASPQAKLHVNGNIIANAPTAENHLATKEYVDSKSSAGRRRLLVKDFITVFDGAKTARTSSHQYVVKKSGGGLVLYRQDYYSGSLTSLCEITGGLCYVTENEILGRTTYTLTLDGLERDSETQMSPKHVRFRWVE